MTRETDVPTSAPVDALRRFDRFYTRQVGALGEHLLQSPFSLAEARVLYEIANRERPTATEIGRELRIDPGYLSRILRQLMNARFVERVKSLEDRRQSVLSLTKKGEKAFSELDSMARDRVSRLLSSISPKKQERLVEAMRTIEQILAPESAKPKSYLLRSAQPGEMGWVISRHGAIYAAEYGWDERFEALVAEIVAEFMSERDPNRERCWIAEMDGEPVGCVFACRVSETIAQLRLLFVEPAFRGLGIGARLIDECIRFTQQTGYQRLRLWTQANLESARRLYEAAGFRIVSKERHRRFGPELTAETWELKL